MRKLNKILLVIVGVLIVCGGYPQTTAVSDYRSLDGYTGIVSTGDDVCPSHGSINSTNTFRVEVNNTDAGETWFEWIVFGGTIIENNGEAVTSSDNDGDNVIGGVPYFYIQQDNYTTASITSDSSEIVVQWHNDDMADSAWVAVRQISQWGCSDSTWSIFKQRVYNQQPEITDFPDSITIAYDDRLNYILPLPTATDPDACFDTLTYNFTITGASSYSGDSVLTNRTVDLGVGVNTVTWTISDLMKDTVRSYTITVDPMPQITNIAWTNPTCFGNNDGTLYISDTLNYAYGGAFQYALAAESDTTFSTDRHFTSLWVGDTTVFAMIEYNVDLDNDGMPETTQQFSEGYTINLHNPSEFAVDDIPDSTSSDVVINNAGCLKDNDGSIEVKFDNVTSLNNSLSFDGVDDYLLLNKYYSVELTDLSVAAWINVPTDNTSSGTIISFDKDDYFQLRLSHAGSNSYVHFVSGAFTTGSGFSNSSVKVNDGKWHLVVATYDHSEQLHSIYVDGVKADNYSATGTIGSSGNVRYGMIGASAEIDTLVNAPQATFFNGSIAEVAVWDNQLLTDEHVAVMMKDGMLNNVIAPAPSDHWALNDTPENVQGSDIQDSVFTDIGNIQTESHWGRFYNGVGLNTQNSPALLSWTDNLVETADSDYPSTNELTNLAVGEYTLHVKDIFACDELTETYKIKNSDTEGPELYWNVALRKNAEQYDVDDNRDASLAVDGYGLAAPGGNSTLTTSQTNAWWKVDLGGVYSPVYKVRIFTGQHGLNDFYVLASNSYPFASPSISDITAPNVTSKHYQVPVPAQDTVVVNLSNIGANVRYLCIMLAGEGAISLAEVEVLTDVGYTVERNLYLTGDSVCTFPVSNDIASIIPYAFDECDGIVSLEHDANTVEPGLGVSDDNLNGAALALGSHVFEWTTFDDAGLSDSLQLTYTVLDTINPYFDPYPFLNSKDTITYCQSLNYKLPITKVYDNYYSCDADTPSIKDLYLKWSYLDETIFSYNDSTFGDYDPNTITDSVLINRASNLRSGDRIFVWQAADYSDNTIYDSLYLHVEEHPLVSEMSISPASCIDGQTQAIFTRIQSEEGRDVNYIMYNVTDDDSIKQTNNNVFNLDPGKYIASIEVNGCYSDEYGDTIEALDVEPIRYDPEINPVVCTGDSGNIVINPTGGSNSTILHFLGGSGVAASVPNYAGLNLDTIGTIEGWIYLDTLTANAANANVGLFGVQNGSDDAYGFRTNGEGVIQFYVGENSINASTVISDTCWYYLRGSWIDDSLNFEIYSDVTSQGVDTCAQRFDSVSAPTGGSLYFGCEGDGSGNNLRGFVRTVRVWNRTLSADEITYNRYLNDPANSDGLMANILINSGTRNLQNRVQGSVNGSINAAYNDFAWQNYAYYWTDNTTGDFVARTRNLIKYPDNYYRVSIHDPLACLSDTVIYLYTNDIIYPTMVFSNEGYNGTPLTVGQPIWRYTSDSIGVGKNISGDCHFYPSSKEFDPYLYDGGCPVDALDLAFVIESGYIYEDSLLDAGATIINDTVFIQSLDGIALTDATTLNWIVTDRAGNSTEKRVTYYIVDDEEPTLSYRDTVYRYTDEGYCDYTVPSGYDSLVPTVLDSCATGTIVNTINGTDSLCGYRFDIGATEITWIYTDRTFSIPGVAEPFSDTLVTVLQVVDDQAPELVIDDPAPLILDNLGEASLDGIDLINTNSEDNCGNSYDIILAKNVAFGKTASQIDDGTWNCGNGTFGPASNAVDGNTDGNWSNCSVTHTSSNSHPWWQVNLGVEHTIYQIRLYNRTDCCQDRLANFYVLISDNEIASPPTDWGNPIWPADVKVHYFPGEASDLEVFNIPADTGRFVRVWNGENYLSLAEVEVYATPSPSDQLDFYCDDVRYLGGGSFGTSNVLVVGADADGNYGREFVEVEVRDNTAPVINQFASPTVAIDSTGVVDMNDMISSLANVTDNCGVNNIYITGGDSGNGIFDCDDLDYGSVTITINAVDVYDNESSKSMSVYLVDENEPKISLQNNVILELGPDGWYVPKPSDFIRTASDNCTDSVDLVYNVSPDTVYCDQRGPITVYLEATDESSNTKFDTIYQYENRVYVVDNLPPTFTVENYTHTIPSTGEAAINFDNIIEDENLHDNCSENEDLLRYIRYEIVDGFDWCGYGNEGGEGGNALFNLADLAAVEGADALSGHPRSYVNDDNPAGNVVTPNMTYYATNEVAGTRTIQYNFTKTYEFNSIEALWADIDSDDGNVILNQVDTLLNLSDSVFANSNWVEYRFSQPVMVANVRLKWNDVSPLSGATSDIEYYDEENGTWEDFASIDNSDEHTTIAIINATESIRRIRINYGASSIPSYNKFDVYGKPCVPYQSKLAVPAATSPGEILISHNWDYLKEVTTNTEDTNLSNVNDEDNAPPDTHSILEGDNNSDYNYWVTYEFYSPVSYSSMEMYWEDNSGSVAAPQEFQIQYSNDGVSWGTLGNYSFGFDEIRNDYVSIDLSGISGSYSLLRLRFTQTSYDLPLWLANWRVYGFPCETYSVPAIISGISEDDSYLEDGDVTVSNDNANKDNLRDGNNSSQWIATTSTSWTNSSVIYNFKEEIVLTGFYINWRAQSSGGGNYRHRNVSIQYEEPSGTWNDIVSSFTPASGDYTYSGSSVTAQNFRIIFEARSTSNTDPGIDEWTIDGYRSSDVTSSGCWETKDTTLYTCPTVSTQLPLIAPESATVAYSDDNGSTWSSEISVGTTAFPGSVNSTDLVSGDTIPANALRLTFDNTTDEGNIGLYEFRAFGRRMPQEGDTITVPEACATYNCSHVHTEQPVTLKVVDEAGNEDSITVDVPVEPYFNINEVQIRDCGYDGERYLPVLEGLSSTNTYCYYWNEIDDGASQSLFYDNGSSIPDEDLPYELCDQDYINLSSSGNIPATYLGYEINLRVEDDNDDNDLLQGCYDTYTLEFDYDASTSSATSRRPWESCVGDIETFNVVFPEKFSFWSVYHLNFYWELDDQIDDDLIYVHDGGDSFVDSDNPGSPSVTVEFLKSTSSNGDVPTDLLYRYQAFGFVGEVSSTHVETSTGETVSGYYLIVVDSLETGGPYWVDYNCGEDLSDVQDCTPESNDYLPEGTKFVRLSGQTYINGSWRWWFVDYYNNGAYRCLESATYEVTVLDVAKPSIYAENKYGDDYYGNLPWIPADSLEICVFDTVWYRVEAPSPDYTYYSWSITNDASENTGRVLAQGNSYDDSIQVIWDDAAMTPTVKLSSFNRLDCTNSDTITHQFTDNEPPLLGLGESDGGTNFTNYHITELDTLHNSAVGECRYQFSDLPAPLMVDNCRDRIANYSCDIFADSLFNTSIFHSANGKINAKGIYPIDTTYVSWTATDYSGNTSVGWHMVIVRDNEAPRFYISPSPEPYTTNNGCTYVFPAADTTANAYATDNCDSIEDVTHLAKIYFGYNEDTEAYDSLQTDLLTIGGETFPIDTSKVLWTAQDTKGNIDSVDFLIIVNDEEVPVVDALPGINVYNDDSLCSANINGSNQLGIHDSLLSDNCTPSDTLVEKVKLRNRSDRLDNDEPFEVGMTELTWRVTDASGNSVNDITQIVTVFDTLNPWLDVNDVDLQNDSITHCQKAQYRLAIPEPYDNCGVDTMFWSIENVTGGVSYSASGEIGRPNFNPNGGFTEIIPELPADSVTGSDYIVTWEILDINTNESIEYSYTLHVEIQPYYDDIEAVESSCANDGSITVKTNSVNFRYEPGREVEFSIDGWQSSQSTDDYAGTDEQKLAQAAQFTGLASGTYDVYMRVNGCDAPEVFTETIEQPEEYVISLSKTDPYCYEEQTGEISLSMTGGAPGQIHFTQVTQTVTADHYELLDSINNEGLGAVQAWVYIESLADGANIVSKGTEYSMKIAEDSTIELSVGGAYVRTNFKPLMQRWYYIVGTWDVDAGIMNIYVDGVASNGATSGILSDISASTDGITVGGGGFKGIVRDLSIWSLLSDGAVPNAKIPSSTSDLLGLWYMNEGTGDAENSLKTNNPSAENISVSPQSLWESTLPQPGTYTWTKTGGLTEATFNTTTDSISMDGLGIGEYTISFQDCYNCPVTPLTDSITLRGTDMTPPEISSMDSLIRYTNDECLFTALGSDTLLWPVISDSCDCGFTTEWKLGGMTFPHSDSIDVLLMLGQNKVEVSTLQNLNVASNLTYYITVRDSTPPNLVVQDVDSISLYNDLYAGEVYYDASGFNLDTEDNCTNRDDLTFQIKRNEEDEYGDEVRFTCDDVGDSVQIFFRAIDESGNIAETSAARMMVQDNHDPRFLYTGEPRMFTECALWAESGGIPAYNNAVPANKIVLDSIADYGDNCAIDSIMYKLEYYGDGTSIINTYSTDWIKCDENAGEIDTDVGVGNDFYEGITRVFYKLFDNHGNESPPKEMFTVDIIPQPEPSGIEGTDGN